MAQRSRSNHKKNKRADSARHDRRPPAAPYQPKPKVTYGKAVVILEDAQRNTFAFDGGAWVPFERTIAECRRDCLVKELPQKINHMTRYEVRLPTAEVSTP